MEATATERRVPVLLNARQLRVFSDLLDDKIQPMSAKQSQGVEIDRHISLGVAISDYALMHEILYFEGIVELEEDQVDA